MDAQTIAAAVRGERQARDTLLRGLQDVWYRFCLGLLGDPEDARDATQETALRFLSRLKDFRGDSQLKTWSLGIALNVVREIRRARRKPVPDLADLSAADTRSTGTPDEPASLAEQRRLVRDVLDELPDRQREALVLRFFEELSVQQTAASMKCAEGTVKATVHQALRALRQKLRQLQ